MKPIIFQLDNVYEDFDMHGRIATFRKSYPDDTEFWIRRSRTSEKEFEAALMKVIARTRGLKPRPSGRGIQTVEGETK